MIGQLRNLWGQRRTATVDQLAHEIAARSITEVHGRLISDATRMTVSELRGYVRARAAQPVRRHAWQVASAYGLRWDAADGAVMSQALERTVHQVIGKLLGQPSGVAGLRIAG